jgi:hypothetical protein
LTPERASTDIPKPIYIIIHVSRLLVNHGERKEARYEKREARYEKRETRDEREVTSYELRVTGGKIREARGDRIVTSCELRVTSCGLRVTGSEPGFEVCPLLAIWDGVPRIWALVAEH